ncbi:MAG: hypothetical protein IJ019_00630 [Alphaproteobacteria bacterium]|nr:hypothetical protein [Alphaproteobacteria bacterium]
MRKYFLLTVELHINNLKTYSEENKINIGGDLVIPATYQNIPTGSYTGSVYTTY